MLVALVLAEASLPLDPVAGAADLTADDLRDSRSVLLLAVELRDAGTGLPDAGTGLRDACASGRRSALLPARETVDALLGMLEVVVFSTGNSVTVFAAVASIGVNFFGSFAALGRSGFSFVFSATSIVFFGFLLRRLNTAGDLIAIGSSSLISTLASKFEKGASRCRCIWQLKHGIAFLVPSQINCPIFPPNRCLIGYRDSQQVLNWVAGCPSI